MQPSRKTSCCRPVRAGGKLIYRIRVWRVKAATLGHRKKSESRRAEVDFVLFDFISMMAEICY